MPLLVHGIVRASEAPPVDEVLQTMDEHVSLVADDELAAVVSHLDDPEVLPSRDNLLGHTRLLESIAATTTVIPLRFGVVVGNPVTLRDAHLARARTLLCDELDRLEGTAEWRLRGNYDERTVITEILASDRRAAHLRGRDGFEDRFELGQRIVKAIEARRDTDLARIERALSPHVRDVEVGEVAQPLDAFVLSLLVGGDQQEAFDKAVDDHAAQVGPTLGLELIGPMPPFSFVAQEAGAWD